MNKRYRRTVIAGNWKMNMTATEGKEFIDELKTKIGKAKWCDIVCCVPFVNIPMAVRALKDARIAVGAQNVHQESHGAYTGEVSSAMLADVGAKYVIVGHSERRQYFGETDAMVNKKAHAVIDAGMTAIICVGESLEQRETGVTHELVAMQVIAALNGIDASAMRKVVFAYEPIWAIGTGRTATAEQAGEICELIRTTVRRLYGARIARAISVLYGGSMNAANAAELLAQPDVDGGLIGGASLKAADFSAIALAANE